MQWDIADGYHRSYLSSNELHHSECTKSWIAAELLLVIYLENQMLLWNHFFLLNVENPSPTFLPSISSVALRSDLNIFLQLRSAQKLMSHKCEPTQCGHVIIFRLSLAQYFKFIFKLNFWHSSLNQIHKVSINAESSWIIH